jgi:hypothetical protein
VNDTALVAVAGFKELRELNLAHTQVTNAGLVHLLELTALEQLTLNYCKQITDAGLASLAGLSALRKLDLRLCSGITDEGLVHLQGLTNLQNLDLAGVKGVREGGRQLADLRRALPTCRVNV